MVRLASMGHRTQSCWLVDNVLSPSGMVPAWTILSCEWLNVGIQAGLFWGEIRFVAELKAIMVECVAHPCVSHAIRRKANIILAPYFFIL